MDIVQIVEGFQQRGSWAKTKEIFQMCDLSTGRGWEDTIKKLLHEEDNNKDDNFITKVNVLNKLYYDFLLIDNKAVRLYSIKREDIDEWIDVFKSYQIEDSIFKKAYPYPVIAERLQEIDLVPHVVKIIDTGEYLSIVFCTKRIAVEREEIKSYKLEEELRTKYHKVVGVKEVYRQYFDVVVFFKKENRVEVRIDMTTGSSNSKDLPSQEIDKAFYQILKSFNVLAKKLTKSKKTLHQSINIFQLIHRLYNSNEGKIVELDFDTDEGSIKHEKMRRKSIDLRKELFHAGGIDNVSHINPYRLLISWDYQIFDLNNTLELLLPGNIKNLSEVPPYLGHFHIKNCICIEEYNFIISKVFTYLRTS